MPLLKQQGFDIEVLCYYKNDFFAFPLVDNDISIHWITPNNYLVRILKIRYFVRRGNYDVVISFLDTPDLLNCLSAIGGHSWKVITSERSAKEAVFTTWRGKFIGWIKKYSDAIVCNSENARQLWLKYYPQYEDKLKVIYNIVTLPEIISTYIPRKDGKTHIVVAASYQYLKNPINVIKAINQLEEVDKVKLVVDWYGKMEVSAGNQQAYNEVVALINEYKLQEIVHLNEAVTAIAVKMNEADAVGLFSRFEGLPNVICEAMTLGKPVIMSRVSDYNILVDESNGLLCDWNDVNSIKEALCALLLLSENQLIVVGEASKKKSELLFEKKAIINQWEKILNYGSKA